MHIKERNNWLSLVEYKYCKNNYYLAIDTIEDDFYLIRLNKREVQDIIGNNLWPGIFDGYSNLFDNEELKFEHNKRMRILKLFKAL